MEGRKEISLSAKSSPLLGERGGGECEKGWQTTSEYFSREFFLICMNKKQQGCYLIP